MKGTYKIDLCIVSGYISMHVNMKSLYKRTYTHNIYDMCDVMYLFMFMYTYSLYNELECLV